MKQAILATVCVGILAAAGGYWAGQQAGTTGQPAATGTSPGERQILYYRNPMGLPDTSPVPKKDPMGMDYLPVFAGDAPEPGAGNQIRIVADKVQKLGVRTEAATEGRLERVIRAAGRVEPDERRIMAITPKFEGYVERLHVNTTGQPVSKGQALFEVYSPELLSAQREYAIAVQGAQALQAASGDAQAGMRQLAEASLARLRNWDISEEQLRSLGKSGETRRTLTFRAPAGGIVTEKKAVQGMRFMPGETLFQVTDLSSVWVVADVFERDMGLVEPGATARVSLDAYPDQAFEGRVAYIYPTLDQATRTIPVRVELPNPGLLLKPGMFARVELAAPSRKTAVLAPASAVIDSGTRQLVLVQVGEGRYEPREVRLGASSDDRVEILTGVSAGEQLVVAANFLIDAESNLKAALGSFGTGSSPASTPPATGSVGHQAEGTVETVDRANNRVSISHGPVASLKWPAMTMEFVPAHGGLLDQLQPGARVGFEFVERGQGEWVITAVTAPGPATGGGAHAGH